MDNQNHPPVASAQPPNPQPGMPPAQTVTGGNQPGKPKLQLSDSEARDLLMLHNLQAAQQPKAKVPIKLVITILGLIVFVVVVSVLLGSFKPGGSSTSSSPGGLGLPNQSSPTSGSDVTNQINHDVKACSNPVNATLAC